MDLRKFVIALCSVVVMVDADYASDESTVITQLKTNYNTEARPLNTTYVFCQLVPFALNSVDIGAETMALSGVFLTSWHDQRLVWDPTTNGINQVIIKPKNVWIPALVVENEIDNTGLLGTGGAPLRVLSNGSVAWTPPISSKTSCSADITYYPYDKQTCTITVIGWSYSIEEVSIFTNPDDPVPLQYLSNNGEWDLLKTGSRYEHLSNGAYIYRKIHFDITFRRKWPYYAQNIILPIILNSVLMAVVFAVPIESGEKMGYCLTVQLSYIVLLTMVSDDLPSISNQTSVIQIYLSIVLCIGTACIVCTTFILRIYNHDESDPVPWWLQTLTKYILAPMVCTRCTRKKKVSPQISNPEKVPAGEDSGGPIDTYSCKEIATILDKFFFLIFGVVLVVMTSTFVGLLLYNYNTA